MKLLTEITHDVKFLAEEKGSKKNYFIEGIFLQAEIKNQNGRIYPREVVAKEVNRFQTLIKENRAMGELNHPNSPTVNLDRVCCRITELKPKGNDVYGKALVLETPMGQIVRGLLEGGCQLGVSSRGVGTLSERNGAKYVNGDFMMTAIDVVSNPSAPDAFVQSLQEGADWTLVNGEWVRDDLLKTLNNSSVHSKKESEQIAAKLFEEFIISLSKNIKR